MTPVTYINLNNLLLIRDIQEITKTYINDDRSYRWIWKNKIADVYHIDYVVYSNLFKYTSMNYKTRCVMSGIFIAILNLIGVIVSSIGVVFVKEWIAKKRRKVVTNLLISKAECWMQLDKIASNIRESLNAKGVYIAYFHNGDKFCNGINMNKFTVIAEDYDISITDSYKNRYKHVLTSIMPYTILRLYRDSKYIFRMSALTKYHSNMYVGDLRSRGCNTAISILIRDLKTDMPIGFLSAEFELDFEPDAEIMQIFWKNHNRISRNMTMVIDATEDTIKN